jgi:hypothetical protein
MVRRHPAAFFAISALAVLTACVAILRSAAFVRNPDVAAWGVTFDLTISLPLLYWFFVVRTGKAQALTLDDAALSALSHELSARDTHAALR